jgi:hypothetical protein
LKDGEAVYKQIGPVLLKQDAAEAKNNVEKRIQFIETEMYVPSWKTWVTLVAKLPKGNSRSWRTRKSRKSNPSLSFNNHYQQKLEYIKGKFCM